MAGALTLDHAIELANKSRADSAVVCVALTLY
jgi:hypothetical protein